MEMIGPATACSGCSAPPIGLLELLFRPQSKVDSGQPSEVKSRQPVPV